MSIRRLMAGGAAATVLLAALPGIAAAADGGEINTGDTAWMLMSTALVMVMLPGLALFYGGLVRRKNVLSTTMHSFFGLALVSTPLLLLVYEPRTVVVLTAVFSIFISVAVVWDSWREARWRRCSTSIIPRTRAPKWTRTS